MRTREPARRARSIVLASLAVAVAALIGALGCLAPAPASTRAAPSPSGLPAPEPPLVSASSATVPIATEAPAARPGGPLPDAPPGPRHGADGVVPDGVTVFDGEVPAVANLDPALLAALRDAATDAAGDGVTFAVTSGWRSRAHQERLLREAVATYGSEAEAARWVATPDTSAHVSGDAVDIGSAAAAWLAERGASYGLCPIYDNEPWHVELRPDAIEHGCPARYADPTHDPRMQR